jgi:PHD/YefM family antitoxin component YafN of YafNO toxin-antitoxin module
MDETDYLLQSQANKERLLKAIQNVNRGENLVSYKTDAFF